MINDHIATPSAIFDELLPISGVRHGIPADMSIISFQILCYPTQKNVALEEVCYLFTVLILYIGYMPKHLRKKSKKIKNYVIRAKGYLTYRVGGVDSVTSVLNIISAE